MNPRIPLVALVAAVALAGGWWWFQSGSDERKIATLEQREAADIAYRRSRGETDAALARGRERDRDPAKTLAELTALLAKHPDSDYLRLQIGRLALQGNAPDATAALAALTPSWAKIEAGLPIQPENLAYGVSIEFGYAQLLQGRGTEAGDAFSAARRLARDRQNPVEDIAGRTASALFQRRFSIGPRKVVEQLRELLGEHPQNGRVWAMLAYATLDDPADQGRQAREALPHIKNERMKREIEQRLAAIKP